MQTPYDEIYFLFFLFVPLVYNNFAGEAYAGKLYIVVTSTRVHLNALPVYMLKTGHHAV